MDIEISLTLYDLNIWGRMFPFGFNYHPLPRKYNW